MELIRAFELFGPIVGDPAVDQERSEAAQVLYPLIHKLSRCLRTSEQFMDDAEYRLICALLQRGPGAMSSRPPRTNEAALRILWRVLVNAKTDAWRFQSKRELDIDPDERAIELVVATGTDATEQLALERCRQELLQANAELQTTIFPALATGMKDRGAVFIETLDVLRRIADGTQTQDSAIAALTDSGGVRVARDRFRKRVSAARERVLAWLADPAEQAARHPQRWVAFEILIDELFDPDRGK
jgi:hypothetical protein